MRGTGKLHSTKDFHLIFFFLFHNIVVLSSTYDVDFMIWFLKRWYFFQEKQKKNQAIMNVFFFFFVAGKFESLLHTHVFSFEIYTAYKVFNPWIFHHVLLLFNKDSIGPFHTHRDVRRHSNIYWKLTDCIFWGVL